ncbi:tRNA ligase [Xylona heveae TC161]|uniref:tRNA ligase n=1 Tax=Xylona heveae (strain CBS 132557 / TC161) TaxID=1328760 RepID=A0A164Z927_XYLHT|nr:tRNA ligase [Xylona heveae TC161]KZF18830.1 tRNA ligase [Xylona heveae TC161]
MSRRDTPPYVPQDPQEVAQIVQALDTHSKKSGHGKKAGFSCRKATFEVEGTNGRTVDSWRFQDWDYKKPDLPTYARGLFTYRNQEGQQEIVVRGYDKFFNVDEVNKTQWRNVENNTRGPYELSVKENGCIIFISGLDDGTLLVCSKHSTGPRDDADLSHATAGEKWVDRHLETVGKTRRDLALELRKMNATAVAELCDDKFEEHVLAYDESRAGLYVHGINLNLPYFATYSGPLVDKFADKWGMRKVEYVMKDDIFSTRKFLEEVAETGSYHGKQTEGFVIRCQAREHEGAPWEDWFFKYKFEEPYLMYRQWREVTRAIIAGKPPKYKKHKKVTEEYIQFARRRFIEDPSLVKAFQQNHGIIALREAFLQERGQAGHEIIREEGEAGADQSEVTHNVVLAPIATIGCGKTTVAVALQKLFGWGHIQNDNIQGKKNRPQRFAAGVCGELSKHPVVIADRNNHQRRERKQIIEDVKQRNRGVQFVALHWVHEPSNYAAIKQAMWNRVASRGDNHQTIQVGPKSKDDILGIMEGFLHRFEPLDDSRDPDDAFDLVINLDVTASSRDNLETVVGALHNAYPKLMTDMPTVSDLDDAIHAAMNDYQPDIKHTLNFGDNKAAKAKTNAQNQASTPKKQKPPKVDFFCIRLPTQRINSILDSLFASQPPETARFYRQLQQTRRVQAAFHVTLIHRAAAQAEKETWELFDAKYVAALAEESARIKSKNQASQANGTNNASAQQFPDPVLATCRVQLERLVWDNRVMCIVARLPDAADSGWHTVNPVAHVTVGTASQDIKPKESNDLLQAWLQNGNGEHSGISELAIPGQIILHGDVHASLQRN